MPIALYHPAQRLHQAGAATERDRLPPTAFGRGSEINVGEFMKRREKRAAVNNDRGSGKFRKLVCSYLSSLPDFCFESFLSGAGRTGGFENRFGPERGGWPGRVAGCGWPAGGGGTEWPGVGAAPGIVARPVLVVGEVGVVGCGVLIAGEVPDPAPALVAGVVAGCPPVGAIPGV
jgi:hypothetical protein